VAREHSTILEDMKYNLEKIPDYIIKRNKFFKEIIYQALSTITMTVSKSDHAHKKEALRKIPIIIYKIIIIQIYHRLLITYLKSGMGHFIIPSQAK
jgi:hypothetical protein